MKNRLAPMTLRRLMFAAAAAAISILLLYAGPATAGIDPQPFMTGLVGVNEVQAGRLNAVNVGNSRAVVELLIVDSTGLVLKSSSHPLDPGQSASLMTDPGGTKVGAGIRGEVRMKGAGRIIPTLEVVDLNTRKTDLVIWDSTEIIAR